MDLAVAAQVRGALREAPRARGGMGRRCSRHVGTAVTSRDSTARGWG
jgi:hypothetical protein